MIYTKKFCWEVLNILIEPLINCINIELEFNYNSILKKLKVINALKQLVYSFWLLSVSNTEALTGSRSSHL
jgi:hypothetical protein